MRNSLLLAVLVGLAVAAPAQNQSSSNSALSGLVRPLITQPLDESQRVALKGNTHPLARTQYDRGAAPPNLPMDRMLLVLKRSPEQESALRQLLDEQQDKASPNYHKWLTPDEFGKQFGVSDSDLQVVTGWLQSHGFNVARVSHGRTVIEFSGTAAQVEQTFGTPIHQYVVKGRQHWANATDPQIPAALAPVVAGVHTLHNFLKKPQLHNLQQRITAKYTPGNPPQITFPSNPPLHALVPGDYQTIYNAKSLLSSGTTGAGQTIAVVGRSNLFGVQGGFSQPQDVLQFRSLFNMCCGTVNVVIDGADPGDLGGGEELEATLDASWAGAVAPNANIDFVVSASTNTTDGVDLSELYIIDNNLAPIITESFGSCELAFTAAQAANIAALAEQAAAQGITYFVSSGDSGSAGCDDPSVTPEIYGPSVNMLASSPYTVAVGGTMFNEGSQASKYWSSTNNATDFSSALSYIPENVWNESCTPATCGQQNAGLWSGGGGSSTFFAKPSWQAGFGPSGARDIPDVSLTAAGHDFYLVCLEASCTPDAQGYISFAGVAGTSASAPSFASIMALVDQKLGKPQGQADYVLYRLAAGETFSQCNGSSSSTSPGTGCIFNDTTVGNNCVPGEAGYPSSCTTYKAGVGYDLATGLGSVNIFNLVNKWNSATFNSTSTTLNLSPTTLTHGASVTANITVTGNSGVPTGDVSLLQLPVPGQQLGQGVNLCGAAGACTLKPGTGTSASLSLTTNALPGGNYALDAHYAGDGNFAPSDSGAFNVTVNPEPSNTSLTVASGFDSAGNPIAFTTAPYGSLMYLRADVAGKSGFGTPTGVVQFLDNGTPLSISGEVLPLGQLNSQGTAWTPNGIFTVGVGTRSLTANYQGDPSFSASTSSATTVTITQASTTTSLQLTGSNGAGTNIVAYVNTPSHGNDPTGTVTFYSGSTALGAPVAVQPVTGNGAGTQSWAFISSPISGNPTLTATYSGDTNYVASTSPALVASPDFVISNNAGAGIVSITPGSSPNLTITLSPVDSFSGTVTFSCSGLPAESTCAFSPTSQPLTTTTAFVNTTLTITTTAPKSGMLHGVPGPRNWWPGVEGGFMFAGVLLAGTRRKSRQRWVKRSSIAVLLLVAGMMGCGGGGGSPITNPITKSDPGTPAGNYNIVVTGTSGKLSHSTSFHLIVQ